MTLTEIQKAVDSGLTVHWNSDGYVVKKDREGYCVVFTDNGYTNGLTEEAAAFGDFYIGEN
jgi:hypothetical protein